jgi:hypothetical protein
LLLAIDPAGNHEKKDLKLCVHDWAAKRHDPRPSSFDVALRLSF